MLHNTVKQDIFTDANFSKMLVVSLEENFTGHKFTIYKHLYSCLGTCEWIMLASHEISKNLHPVKISLT